MITLPMSLALAVLALAAEQPILSSDQLTKLFANIDKKETSTHVPGEGLGRALKLFNSKKDEYSVRFAAVNFTDAEGAEHSFGVSRKTGDYLIVVKSKKEGVRYVRADKQLKLVAGAVYGPGRTEPPELLQDREAEALLAAELALWRARVDAPAPKSR